MKPWKSSFKVPIYGMTIHVVVAKNLSEGHSLLPYGLSDTDEAMVSHPCCQAMYSVSFPDYAILFKNKTPHDEEFYHEIGHVCRRLMNDIGWKIDAINDEPLAYLEGWMAEKVKKVLKKAPKK